MTQRSESQPSRRSRISEPERLLSLLTITRPMGPLEAEVMDVVWEQGRATVNDVYEALLPNKNIAYTTVLSTMSNLTKKGLLDRTRYGKAHIYTPRVSRSQVAESKIGQIVDTLLDHFTESATQHFVDKLNRISAERLAKLESLLAEKRSELESAERLDDQSDQEVRDAGNLASKHLPDST